MIKIKIASASRGYASAGSSPTVITIPKGSSPGVWAHEIAHVLKPEGRCKESYGKTSMESIAEYLLEEFTAMVYQLAWSGEDVVALGNRRWTMLQDIKARLYEARQPYDGDTVARVFTAIREASGVLTKQKTCAKLGLSQ